MINRQKNKLSMMGVVERILDEHAAIWNTIPAFANVKNNFSAQLQHIRTLSAEQASPLTGISTDKRKLKTTLVINASSVAGAISSLAHINNDHQLKAQVKFTARQLFKLRDNKTAGVCKNIYDLAIANASALVPYGITALQLTALQNDIDFFRAKTPEPKAAIANRISLGKSLDAGLANAHNLLKLHLDNLMRPFQLSHPLFFNAYKAARLVIDLGIMHTRLIVTVKDTEGNPLSGATVEVITAEIPHMAKSTNARGIVRFSPVKPGTHNLRIRHNGFRELVLPEINFIAGKNVERRVRLQAS